MNECAVVKKEILYIAVRPEALAEATGSQVSSEDVAVFADAKLVSLISRRGWQVPKKHKDLLLFAELLAQRKLQQDADTFQRTVREAVQAAAKLVGSKKKASTQAKSPPSRERRDPHEILGVPRGASASELRRARDRRLETAHPDKLAQFDPALVQLANELTAEINWAYDTLRKKAAA